MKKAKLLDSQLNKSQRNIKTIVEDYQWMFKDEYELFLKEIKYSRENQADDFATVEGFKDDMVRRKLGEMPETMHAMMLKRLDEEDKNYMQSKKGARWFYKYFPQFRITKEI